MRSEIYFLAPTFDGASQSADFVAGLEHIDLGSALAELIGRCDARGSRTDYCNAHGVSSSVAKNKRI
jgi:hypothetical protein